MLAEFQLINGQLSFVYLSIGMRKQVLIWETIMTLKPHSKQPCEDASASSPDDDRRGPKPRDLLCARVFDRVRNNSDVQQKRDTPYTLPN